MFKHGGDLVPPPDLSVSVPCQEAGVGTAASDPHVENSKTPTILLAYPPCLLHVQNGVKLIYNNI